MKKLFLFTLILVTLLIPFTALAENVTYKGQYTSYDLDGKERWKASAKIVEYNENILILTEEGSGRYYPFKDNISWVATLEFKDLGKSIKPLKSLRKIFDKDNNPIALETQIFDFKTSKVNYTYEDLITKNKVERSFTFNKDIVNRLILPLYVAKFLENNESKRYVQMITDEPKLYNVNLRVIKDETIDIDGKAIETTKVVIDPNLGLFNIFKVLIPKSYIWHNKSNGFLMQKYKGLESSPSSPKIRIVVE